VDMTTENRQKLDKETRDKVSFIKDYWILIIKT